MNFQQKRLLKEGIMMNKTQINEKDVDRNQSPQLPQFPQFQGVLQIDKLTPALKKFVEMSTQLSDAPDEFTVPSLLACWAGVVGNKLIGPNNNIKNLFQKEKDEIQQQIFSLQEKLLRLM